MSLVKTVNTTTACGARASRRSLLASAGLLAVSAAAVVFSPKLPPTPSLEMTPITAAGVRLKHLCALEERDLTADEFDAVTDEQLELSDVITESSPLTVIDAMILLMAATAEIRANHLHEDGTYSFEHGDIMVRRVVRFLAGHAGVSTADFGGTFLQPSEEHEAIAFEGTVAEAAARFNRVDEERALERHDDYRNTLERHLIMARHGIKPRAQIEGRA